MIEKKFALIGKPISHSISPALHNFWFKKYKIAAKYFLLEITEDKIEGIINKIRKKEIKGINVTIPYKKTVVPYLDEIINDAEKTSSVNTIYLDDRNRLIGENTDVYGFEKTLTNQLEKNLSGKDVLILGAGGVTSSIIYVLKKLKVKNIFISNRSVKKTEEIKKTFSFINIILWEQKTEKIKEIDLLINATSLGTKNELDFPQMFLNFKKNLIYYDLVYNPAQTKLMKHFIKNNIKVFNGLEMLIYQGQKAFNLWNKINPEVNDVLKKKIMRLV
tara:strand:- start:1683 stop:2507 length:825 start_codon:yes stop_codon:yes gene_type:complete